MKQYREYEERANLEPFSEEDITSIERRRNEVVNEFGQDMNNDYGWASPALNKAKPTLFDLEIALGLDHWRPRYRWASQYNHANYKPPMTLLGATEATDEIVLIGPSNSGHIDPAQMTAYSLLNSTSALLMLTPNLDRLVIVRLLTSLANEIGEVFLETERRTYNQHQKMKQPTP